MRHSRTGPHGPRSTRRVATALAGVIAVVGAMVITAPVASAAIALQPLIGLTKTWVNGVNGDTSRISINAATEGIGASTSTANGDSESWTDALHSAAGSAARGATFTLGETLGSENVGTYSPTYACTYTHFTADKHLKSDPLAANEGTSFTMPDDAIAVFCTVTNTNTPATVTVTKTWSINGVDFTNDQAMAMGFAAHLTVDGTSATWGSPLSGYFAGGEMPVVDEGDVTYPEGWDCWPTSDEANSASGFRRTSIGLRSVVMNGGRRLKPGDNAITIRNTIGCQTGTLTLIKTVSNGNAQETDWTLTAAGPTSISGRTGDGTVTGAKVLPGAYTLTESGPGNYTQTSLVCTNNTAEYLRSASGSFRAVSDGNIAEGNSVTIDPGDDVTCTFTNTYNPPPPPPPSPITVTPAFTVQCVLVGNTSNVTVTTTAVTGISYTVTNNGTSSVTVTAAAQPGYALSVPAKWTGNSSSATIVVTAKDATTCVGDESATVVSTTDPSTSAAAVVATTSTSVAVMAASTQITSLSYTGVKAWQMSVLALLLLGGGALLLTAGSLWRRKPQKH